MTVVVMVDNPPVLKRGQTPPPPKKKSDVAQYHFYFIYLYLVLRIDGSPVPHVLSEACMKYLSLTRHILRLTPN